MLVEAAASCLHLAATLGCGAELAAVGEPRSTSGFSVADVCPAACQAEAAVQFDSVTFSLTGDAKADWFFAGQAQKWVEEEGSGWIVPDKMTTPEDGNLAVLTKPAFSTFNVSLDFIVGQGADAECWSTAAFVFQATDAQHYKMIEFPYQGQQNRAEHFWAQISEVSDSSGWRETMSMQGPVHGVSSGNSWPHTARAELGADGYLHIWVDGRPLRPVHVGVSPGYVGLASYNLLGNDVGRVKHVTVSGAVDPGAPAFDKTVKLGRGFTNIEIPGKGACTHNVTVDCVGTTHVGRMVRAPNGDLIATNGATLLRTPDNGTTWSLDSGNMELQHMMNVVHEGKPALANLEMKAPGAPPCADCAYPPGTKAEMIRRYVPCTDKKKRPRSSMQLLSAFPPPTSF
jgi:hypothetical protein